MAANKILWNIIALLNILSYSTFFQWDERSFPSELSQKAVLVTPFFLDIIECIDVFIYKNNSEK